MSTLMHDVVTESWFSNNILENQVDISNCNLVSTPLQEEKGDGCVAIYVKEDISASYIYVLKTWMFNLGLSAYTPK